MAANRLGDGKKVYFTAGADLTGGTLLAVGTLVGVVQGDVLDTELGVIDTEGVYEVPLTTGSPTEGARVFHDASTPGSVVLTAAAGDIACGHVVAVRGLTPASGNVFIRLQNDGQAAT